MTSSKVWTTGAAALLAACVTGFLGIRDSAAQTTYSTGNDPTRVIISYQEILGELRADDPGPSVKVFADGRVVVHRPSYMKQAGDYEMQLSQAELDDLIASVTTDEILAFDPKSMQQAKRAANAARRSRNDGEGVVEYVVVDAGTTVIEIDLNTAGPGRAAQRVRRTARWNGLDVDVEKYPQIEALQELHRAEKKLRALRKRESLRPVSPAAPAD